MIPEAETFNAACRAYDAARAKRDDLEIDVKIADRRGDNQSVELAKKASLDYMTLWAEAYLLRQETAFALCGAIGVASADLKAALY